MAPQPPKAKPVSAANSRRVMLMRPLENPTRPVVL